MLWWTEKIFNQPGKTNLKAYDNIRKIATGQWDNYTTVVYWIISISKITIDDSNRFH